jgi:hypothetical protein
MQSRVLGAAGLLLDRRQIRNAGRDTWRLDGAQRGLPG